MFDFDSPPSMSNTKRINAAGAVAANVNRTARGTPLPLMLCPSDGNNQVMYKGTGTPHSDNWARGNYAANAGRAFILGSTGTTRMQGPYGGAGAEPVNWNKGWKDNCKRGVMGPNQAVKLRHITDGTTKSMMIGEIRAGLTELDGRGVWALGHAGASLLAMHGGGGDADGPNACYGNGSSDDIYSDVCTGAAAPGIAAVAQAECMSCLYGNVFQQATARSSHTAGGVHVAMCDGSVQWVSDDVETTGGVPAIALGQTCCSVWDRMIASADGDHGGGFNGVTTNPCQ
jgi:hypothetical protein